MKVAEDFKRGFQSALPICIGYVPLAIAYGVLGKAAGLSNGLIVLMSLLVYSGAAQFTSINLFATGVPGLDIVLTTFFINSRHVIMSTSLSRKLSDKVSRVERFFLSFGITDESFSVASMEGRDRPLSFGQLAGITLPPYIFWVAGSALGILFSSLLPQGLEESMGMALYAMFIALLVPNITKSKKLGVLVVGTGVFHQILIFLFSSNGEGKGWMLVVAAVAGALAGTMFIDWEELHG